MLWLKAGLLACVLERLGAFWSDQIYLPFAWPSAKIAAIFLGSSILLDDNGQCWIPLPVMSIHVTPDCTGYGFFCLITAVMGVFYIKARQKTALWQSVVIVAFTSYLITILTNGVRIVSAYKIHRVALSFFPGLPAQGVHMMVGLTIFLTVFLLVYLILERMTAHDRYSIKTVAA